MRCSWGAALWCSCWLSALRLLQRGSSPQRLQLEGGGDGDPGLGGRTERWPGWESWIWSCWKV